MGFDSSLANFLGFWCGFDGVEWESICFGCSHGWWHYVALTHFRGFGGILVLLNGNQLFSVTTMDVGTDQFFGFWLGDVLMGLWWGFDGVLVAIK